MRSSEQGDDKEQDKQRRCPPPTGPATAAEEDMIWLVDLDAVVGTETLLLSVGVVSDGVGQLLHN
jgi:hypothetical protein